MGRCLRVVVTFLALMQREMRGRIWVTQGKEPELVPEEQPSPRVVARSRCLPFGAAQARQELGGVCRIEHGRRDLFPPALETAVKYCDEQIRLVHEVRIHG